MSAPMSAAPSILNESGSSGFDDAATVNNLGNDHHAQATAPNPKRTNSDFSVGKFNRDHPLYDDLAPEDSYSNGVYWVSRDTGYGL